MIGVEFSDVLLKVGKDGDEDDGDSPRICYMSIGFISAMLVSY